MTVVHYCPILLCAGFNQKSVNNANCSLITGE